MPAAQILKKSKRLILFAAAALAAVELFYVTGANLALRSDWLIEKINHRPDRFHLEWDKAWTVVPGFITMEGARARGQSKRNQWYLETDRLKSRVSLLPLLSRTLRTYSLRADGMEFRLRRTAEPEAGHDTNRAAKPPIPGLEPDAPSPPRKEKKDPWTIDLRGARLRGIRQMWIQGYRLGGDLAVQGALNYRMRGRMQLRDTSLTVEDGALRYGEETLVHELSARLRLDLGPYSPREEKGIKILPHLSGAVEIRGRSTDLSLLNAYLSPPVWPVFDSPEGAFDGLFRLERGVLQDGSRFHLEAGEVTADLLDWEAKGTAELEAVVEAATGGQGGEARGRIRMALSDVEIIHPEDGSTLVETPLLEMNGSGLNLDLAEAFSTPESNLEQMNLEIGEADVPDLKLVNELLPAKAGLVLSSGVARSEMNVTVSPERVNGRVLIEGTGVQVDFRERPLRGDLTIELLIENDGPVGRRLDISGTSVTLENFITLNEEDAGDTWSGVIRVDEGGTLTLAKPVSVDGRLVLEMQDTRPVVALFVRDKKLLKYFERLLTIENLEGVAHLAGGPHSLDVNSMEITGDNLLLLANARLFEKKMDGILFTRFHGVRLGLERAAGSSSLKVFKPRKWYDRRAAEWAGK